MNECASAGFFGGGSLAPGIIKCEGTTVTHLHECETSFSILCGITFVVVVV